MLTIESLRAFGADVDAGITRCMGKEDLYLMFIGRALNDERLFQLEKQLRDKDFASAFETAHALKGMFANLSLDPLTLPVSEMAEMLRSRTDTDYSSLIMEAKIQFERLRSL